MNFSVSYNVIESAGFSPPVTLLFATKGWGDGGYGWNSKRIYYYNGDIYRFLREVESFSSECDEEKSVEIGWPSNPLDGGSNKNFLEIKTSHIFYTDCKPGEPEIWIDRYLWADNVLNFQGR